MLKEALWFGMGYAAWPAFEYAFHRWIFHNPDEDTTGANVHTEHHRHPEEYNDFTWGQALSELKELVPVVMGSLLGGTCLVLGPRRGIALTAGLVTHWVFYERVHLVTHAQEDLPTSEKERHLFRHHMIHHFKNPKANFGFTTDFFDKLFNTYEEVDMLAIPAHMAPKWLKDDLPGYKLVGKRKMAS